MPLQKAEFVCSFAATMGVVPNITLVAASYVVLFTAKWFCSICAVVFMK